MTARSGGLRVDGVSIPTPPAATPPPSTTAASAPLPVSATGPKAPVAVTAWIAFVIVVVQTVLYFITKIVGGAMTSADIASEVATVFGVLGILSLLPPVVAVVLAHIALVQTRTGAKRGRVIAAIALGVGYLHIGMWANRIIVAVIAALQLNDPAQIVPGIFWWA